MYHDGKEWTKCTQPFTDSPILEPIITKTLEIMRKLGVTDRSPREVYGMTKAFDNQEDMVAYITGHDAKK
tara:strand:- start:169 stop:378 length:210 start_codon:yes stop_codon:yes gene_type:complete